MKKLSSAFLSAILVCAICMVGCTSDHQGDSEKSGSSSSEQLTSEQIEEMYLSGTDGFASAVSASLLSPTDENTCISPISLYYALGMLASGVQGDAQSQILQVLGMQDADQLEQACRYGISELDAEDDLYKLAIADSIWVSQDYELSSDFKRAASEDFDAEAFSVKFGTKQADSDMSKWVSDKTNGLLSPIFQTQKEQIASLINTIYFNDAWVEQFSTEQTSIQVFHSAEGDISAPFMNNMVEGCGFAETDGFSMAELYFTSGSTMTFFLPNPGVTPQSLIDSPEAASALLAAEPDSFPNINFSIPKFSFSTNMGDLISVLSDMGITDVFTNPSGDAFEGMLTYTGEGTPGVPYVSDVRQETNISISEEGVEAAAYTEVGIEAMSAPDPSQPIDFVLDRPFLFKLTAPDSAVLFVGMVVNPIN